MHQEKAEILVIGAGVIGSATALHLAQMGASGVRVIDFDLEGTLSSSELNAGGVRGTWNQPINIQMSKVTIDYFDQVAADVGYRPVGYLWLQTSERMPGALKARELQLKQGWDVEAWDIAELKRRTPFIDKTDDLGGAVFGKRDGLVNPNLLKLHFREKARAKGATFDDRVLVRSSETLPSGKIRITTEKLMRRPTPEEKLELAKGNLPESLERRIVQYEADRIVNCAGAWSSQIARILGYSSPGFPVRRQACIFDCRDVDLTPYGMVIDTSGVYFHPEASNGLAGFAIRNEPNGVNYAYDGESFFMEYIWPALYERSTKFERLKHLTGWAGLYDVSPDDSAIIGACEANPRVFEAHSFSGHGVMHSYSAGLALAELMIKGRYETIDASPLSAKRFTGGNQIHESAVI